MTSYRFRRVVIITLFWLIGLHLLGASIAPSAAKGQAAPITASDLPPQSTATPASFYKSKTEPVRIEPPTEVVLNQVVLKFAPGVSARERTTYLREFGGRVVRSISSLDTVVVSLPPQASEHALANSAAIRWAEPDYYVTALDEYVPNDPRYEEQWALPVIGAPEAWADLPPDAPTVMVAVIDSGVCGEHPELAGRVAEGWDFLENDAVPQDDFGHGCSVAGVIAANMDDEIGIAGVAPNAQIMPLRVLNESGIGTYSDVAAAIVHATDNGAKVINLSLGGSNPSSILEDAVNYAVDNGVLVVAAAGNSGTEGALYPAAYQSVVAVGSIDPDLQPSNFSNYGADIDLWAPGHDIVAVRSSNDYGLISGTSFAAPHVSGIASLLIAFGDSLTVNGGIVAIRDSSPPLPPVASPEPTVEPPPVGVGMPDSVFDYYIADETETLQLRYRLELDTVHFLVYDKNTEQENLAFSESRDQVALNLIDLSPAGDFIAYVSTSNTSRLSGASIRLVDVKANTVQEILTASETEWFVNPLWSPDSSKLAFVRGFSESGSQRGELWYYDVVEKSTVLLVADELFGPVFFYGKTLSLDWKSSNVLQYYDELGTDAVYDVYVDTLLVREADTLTPITEEYVGTLAEITSLGYEGMTLPIIGMNWYNGSNSVTAPPLTNPTYFTVHLDNYSGGEFEGEGLHPGVDINAPSGTPVRSVGTGIVRANGWDECFGNYVIVELSPVPNAVQTSGYGGTVFAIYEHLESRTAPSVNQPVSVGDQIGTVGETGTCSEGVHLHFAIDKDNGQYHPYWPPNCSMANGCNDTSYIPLVIEHTWNSMMYVQSHLMISGITVYDYPNYNASISAASERFNVRDPFLRENPIGDNRISSARIPDGWVLIACKEQHFINYPENCQEFTSDVPDFSAYGLDNQISSIKVGYLMCPASQVYANGMCIPDDDPPGEDDTTAPSGHFTNPANGSTISDRSVTVSVEASDNSGGSGVREVRFSAKWSGQWHGIGTDSSYPYSINWDWCNANVPNGDVELGMEIWDNAGNVFIWSRDGGSNPHITKNYVCTGDGGTLPGGSWETWAWMNKYLAGYDNWHGYYTWDNGNWPYIWFDWGSGAPFNGWASNEFSFRLQRDVYFPGGDYQFEVHSDDGVRVYVDGNIVLNKWWDAVHRDSATRRISEGTHQVKVEYYENGGDALLGVWWYGPGYPRPDNNPPDGRITSPENLSAVNNSPLTVAADAWDDASGVERVVFSVWHCQPSCNWRTIGTDYSAPYSVNWNWSALSDAHVWLKIDVYDKTGKWRGDAGGWVELDLDRGKPVVRIDSPTDDEILRDNLIPIQVTANDALSGVDRVQFFVGYSDTTAASAQAQPELPPPAPPDSAQVSGVTSLDYWHEVGWDQNGANGWSLTWDASSIPDQSSVAFFVYTYDKAGNYEGDVVWNTTLDRTRTVEVASVTTTDENGFAASANTGPLEYTGEVGANAVKTEFNTGDPIKLWIETDNQFDTNRAASFKWLVLDPVGQPVPELSWTGELTSSPGVTWWYLSSFIPVESLSGDYTFFGSITFNGETSSKLARFSVNGINSVVVLDVFATDETGAAALMVTEPRQTQAGDAESYGIQTGFNAGDPIQLYIDTYNNVAENEVASFTWTVYDPWDRKVNELSWAGDLASYYGRSWWSLSSTIPGNAVTGDYTFIGSIIHNGRETTDSVVFHVEGSPGPANDDFDAPTVITNTPFADVIDTRGATVATDDPVPSCGSGSQESSSVWYQFTPLADGILRVDTEGSDYDTVLALWTGSRGSLTGIGCNDDVNSTLQSLVSVPVTSGTTYYIEITAYGSRAAGLLSLSVDLVDSLLPPSLLLPTDGSTTTDSTPTFSWNANSGATRYRFQIDDNSDFSSLVDASTTRGTSYTPSSALAAGIYYWRVSAGDGADNWSSYSDAWEVTVDITTTGEFRIYLPSVVKP